MLKKLNILILVFVYCIIFVIIYIEWASNIYSRFGFIYQGSFGFRSFFTALVILVLTMILPTSVRSYASFFSWVLFLMVFIPSTLTITMQQFESFESTIVVGALAVSFFLILKMPQLINTNQRIRISQIDSGSFFTGFFILYIIFNLIILYSYKDVMSFANIDTIYSQRTRASESGVSRIVPYLIGIQQNAFNPFLITNGLLIRNRRWMLVLGLLGQVMIYTIFAGKIILASVIVMIGVSLVCFPKGHFSIIRFILGPISVMMLVLFILHRDNYLPDGIALEVTALLYMRTFAIQGVMTGVYADFFSTNPYTYGSHINIINWVIEYPYDSPMGIIIGRYLVGGKGFNANSHFWISDGLSGLGAIGIILIGVVIGTCLSFINRVIIPERLKFASITSIPYLMSLSNGSFFTSLITGGGFVLFILMAYGAPTLRTGKKRK